jgi:ParB/Sulfiredoxin domain
MMNTIAIGLDQQQPLCARLRAFHLAIAGVLSPARRGRALFSQSTIKQKETNDMKTWKVHPAALAFPQMPTPEFNELKADIAANGIRMPILVNKEKDMIIDGRNRMMAAHDLKLPDSEIPLEVFSGTEEEAVTQIVLRNIRRRHLTDDQRVAIVAKLRGRRLIDEAEVRERAGIAAKSIKGRSWQEVATEAQVSQHKARAALTTATHAPTDLDRVIAGKEKLRTAYAQAKAKRGQQAGTAWLRRQSEWRPLCRGTWRFYRHLRHLGRSESAGRTTPGDLSLAARP